MTIPSWTGTSEHRGIDPGFDVRETPTALAWPPDGPPPPQPGGFPEPVLAMANIQGNVVAGFNKNHQTLLYFRIDDPRAFKPVVAELGHWVATADEVLAFNRLFKRMRDRRGDAVTVKSTWINLAFSFAGLSKLRRDAEHFRDPWFRDGLVGPPARGAPESWKVSDRGDRAADVLIIVAGDEKHDVDCEVRRVGNLVEGRGATFVGQDEGKARCDGLVGHEHFGFLDGISQPGLRGRASEDPTDVLTPRQNLADPDEGKPGQELIWPGEFVFGYPAQIGSRDGVEPGGDASFDGAGTPQVPVWARDGSYLVFRRLRQDVFRFHRFLHDQGMRLRTSPEAVGARLVGRWRSGAPIMRARAGDDRELANDDCANNHFLFQQDARPVPQGRDDQCPFDRFQLAEADPPGFVCPLNAHIRKANPRDDVVEVAGRRLHRMLRRGIPFGDPSPSTPDRPRDDGEERGLLFLAYMTSIDRQFAFVTDQWIENAHFPARDAGTDALLGRRDWIVLTGGGNYFAPSVSALKETLSS
jgi:Dyp-type peroxidase family